MQRTSTLLALQIEDSRALLFSHALSRFCSWLIFMILLEKVQSNYGGALPIALLILTRRIPTLLGSQPGGYLADFMSAKKLLIALNLFTGISSTLLLYLVGASNPTFNLLIVVYGLISFAEGAYKPSLAATLVRMPLNEKKSLKSLNTTLNAASMLVVISAGLLSAFLDMKHESIAVLSFCALGFLLSSVLLVGIKQNASAQEVTLEAGPSYYSLFKSIKRPVLLTSLSALLYGFISLIAVQFPYRVYNNASMGMGILFLIVGLGTLAGSLIYKFSRINRSNSLSQIGILFVATCAFLLIFVQFTNFAPALLGLFGVMLFYAMTKLDLDNFVILSLPASSIGRTFALMGFIEEFCIGLATLIFAKAFELYEPLHAGLIGSAGLLVLSLWQYFSWLQVRRKEKSCLLEKFKSNQVA